VLSSAWQFQLLYYQIRNISSNLTTNEDINQSRYEYLQFKTEDDEYVFANPFDAGPIQNFRQFCFSEMNWYHLYHCPEKKLLGKGRIRNTKHFNSKSKGNKKAHNAHHDQDQSYKIDISV